MCALGNEISVVTQYIHRLRGGSQPILVRANDGYLYVLKFANNLQGPNLLFNESAGTELYRACGLPVPKWRPLKVSDSFLDINPACWMHTPEGRLRPASGLCFGSRFLGGNGRRLFEILPGSSIKRVRDQVSFWKAWLIDICGEHVDNRQAIFAEAADGWLDAYFVDHGHLFGGPKGDLKLRFCASRYLDQRIYGKVTVRTVLGIKDMLEAVDIDRVRGRIQTIPSEWTHASARASFERCLERLATLSLVEHVADAMFEQVEQLTKTESGIIEYRRKAPREVLRIGLQIAGS